MNVIMIDGDNCKWWLIVITIDFGDWCSDNCGWADDEYFGWWIMIIEVVLVVVVILVEMRRWSSGELSSL